MTTPTEPQAPPTRGITLRTGVALYDIVAPLALFMQTPRINRRAMRLLDLEASDRVLDVGCATGTVTMKLARRLNASAGGLVAGLDASPEMVLRARRKARCRRSQTGMSAPPLLPRSGRPAPPCACRFDLGVAERMPYADASFDKAVSTEFFHHLCLDDKRSALCEVRRVLRPGGRFVVADIDVPTSWLGHLCARAGEWLFTPDEIAENIDGKLFGLFAEVGFVNVRRVAHDLGYLTTFLMRKPG